MVCSPAVFVSLYNLKCPKLAPWQWDNIKVLIYCFIVRLPFIAYAISWMWRKGNLICRGRGRVFFCP